MESVYDLIIVGAGPAGLAAGIYAGERQLKSLILEANIIGGQPATLYAHKNIYDYPGIPDIRAGELAVRMKEQAERFKAPVQTEVTVRDFGRTDRIFTVRTSNGKYSSRSILLAVGMGFFQPRKLGIPGEGLPGVAHIFPDPDKFRGKRVLCVGGGETAVEGALTAQRAGAEEVCIVHRREEFRAVEKSLQELREGGAVFVTPCEVTKIAEEDDVKKVTVVNNSTNEEITIEADNVCIHIGFITDSSLVEKWGLKIERHAVVVDQDMQTSIAGIFACGDVTIPQGEYKRITIAQGQSAVAVHGVYKYLKRPYWG